MTTSGEAEQAPLPTSCSCGACSSPLDKNIDHHTSMTSYVLSFIYLHSIASACYILTINSFDHHSTPQQFYPLPPIKRTNMSGSNVVHVKGIAPATTEKEVRDFFSFWYVDRDIDTFFI
jgi:hypothetical protein